MALILIIKFVIQTILDIWLACVLYYYAYYDEINNKKILFEATETTENTDNLKIENVETIEIA